MAVEICSSPKESQLFSKSIVIYAKKPSAGAKNIKARAKRALYFLVDILHEKIMTQNIYKLSRVQYVNQICKTIITKSPSLEQKCDIIGMDNFLSTNLFIVALNWRRDLEVPIVCGNFATVEDLWIGPLNQLSVPFLTDMNWILHLVTQNYRKEPNICKYYIF